jgi:hypothetical protein
MIILPMNPPRAPVITIIGFLSAVLRMSHQVAIDDPNATMPPISAETPPCTPFSTLDTTMPTTTVATAGQIAYRSIASASLVTASPCVFGWWVWMPRSAAVGSAWSWSVFSVLISP